MKRVQLIFTSIILTACLVACQKQISFEDGLGPTLPPSILGDSVHLDKLYFVDVTGGNETLSIATYHYDNLKRVDSIKEIIRDNGSGPWQQWYSVAYFYNGNDTLPFKSISNHFESAVAFNDPSFTDTITTFHQYLPTGQNLSDSAILSLHYGDGSISSPFAYDRFRVVEHYQYQGNSMYRQATYTPIASNYLYPVTLALQRDSAITDGNGNMLSSKHYSVSNNISTLEFTSSITYDNKVNPFSKISDFKTIKLFPEDFADDVYIQSSKNRLYLKVTDANGNIEEDDRTGKYTYRNDGFPLKLLLQPQVGVTYAIVFTYKNL